MKSLDKFAGLEISNTEEVKGGTFGCFSLFSVLTSCFTPAPCYSPAPAPCYTPAPSSCSNGGYSNNSCAPAPSYCSPSPCKSYSFSYSRCR